MNAWNGLSSCDMLMSTQYIIGYIAGYIAGVIDMLELLMSTHYIIQARMVLFMIDMLMSTENRVVDMLDILMELLICCLCSKWFFL